MDETKLKKLVKEGRILLKKTGNRFKGNPNPKIHLNYNIKYTRKIGPTSYWGKIKSSMNAMKYQGRALRINKNSLYAKEFEKWLEREFRSFLNDLEIERIRKKAEKTNEKLFRNL